MQKQTHRGITVMKFLVVDDEHDVEMLFMQKFRKEIRSGLIELEFAFSGQDALDRLHSIQPPDVLYIFSDINMPGMSGLELLDKVKSEFPQIEVSMVSAYGDDENYQKAIEYGAKGFFTKPIDFSSLKQEVLQMLEE
jgi:CheY-like chemotaxis protein